MTDPVARKEPNGLSVLISGGGVGGLMTALECWRQGFNVRIFEKAKVNQTHGDSVTIGPSATDCFRNWPRLHKREQEICYHPLVAFFNTQGELLRGPFEFSHLTQTNVNIGRHNRPKFHGILLEQLTAIGLEVEYDKEVVDYFEDAASQNAGVILKDGSRYEADLIVAADGGRSSSWTLVAGHPVPARSSGNAIFRTSFSNDLVMAEPEVAKRFAFTPEGRSLVEVWWGPISFVAWRNEDAMEWALNYPDTGEAQESWGHRVSPERALAVTATVPDFPEVANKLISITPPQNLVDWKLMFRDPQPTWTSPAGHVLQLGDAAHTFLPSSGNGATQALEDAISLGACLSKINGKKDIPDALRTHNLLRFERVSFLQAFGVVAAWKRNSKNSDINKKSTDPSFGEWITEHDPEKYALDNYDAALAHLQSGAPFKNTNGPTSVTYTPWTIDGLRASLDNHEPTIFDDI